MNLIRTDRLTLEPQVAAHAEEMFAVLSDPAIYEHENEPPGSVDSLRERFRKLESRCSPDGSEQWLNWIIRLRSSEPIGFVQATVMADSTAVIAYVLNSKYWGHGFASDAVRAMIGELAIGYRVAGLGAILKKTNHRSLRLLERIGFRPATERDYDQFQVDADELLMLADAEMPDESRARV
jgi:RimJ/RimL family protein N-acetyltransferase